MSPWSGLPNRKEKTPKDSFGVFFDPYGFSRC